MDGVTLLREAAESGLAVTADDGRLVVRGPRRLEALAKRLIEHKPMVLAALAGEPVEIIGRTCIRFTADATEHDKAVVRAMAEWDEMHPTAGRRKEKT
ncbi:MAG: hypothetical protein HOP29_02210 [Phycisphaerales bacterium]|nr:hypothetical protein [Phycisphaerales bacterium]